MATRRQTTGVVLDRDDPARAVGRDGVLGVVHASYARRGGDGAGR